MHPDFVATPSGAFGHPFHLAITPYPYSNPAFENPSFFESDRRSSWALPDGGPNPVAEPALGYLSDPDLVWVPESGELWLYYRQVHAENTINLIRTHDGVTWSDAEAVVHAPNHEAVSPSVVRRAADDWWMFAVNSGNGGCEAASTTVDIRRSSDGRNWSGPEPVDLSQAGLWPWHIDVQWIPSRGVFWALYNGKDSKGCATPALYLAESADGFHWTVLSRPVITKGASRTIEDIVYRSTFEYDPVRDAITFWISGARYEHRQYIWGAVVERRSRAALFAPSAALRQQQTFSPAPAPLHDWP